eukprot:c9303_g1_i1.p1 GENE.c9303_g1_i1~~c9303_g1_i1.p1  ORF type:complete len:217 (-),score=35.49 c9303_g1_i1:155-739(-)
MTQETHVAIHLGRFLESLCLEASADSVFKCVAPPPIDILDYAERLGQFSRCSVEALQTTAVLLFRLHQKFPALFCPFSAHKLLAAALVVGIKFEDDKFCRSSFYAECAGVCVKELNFLEYIFLMYLDFSVFVHPEESSSMGARLLSLTPLTTMFTFEPPVAPQIRTPAEPAAKSLEMDVDFSWNSLLNCDAING